MSLPRPQHTHCPPSLLPAPHNRPSCRQLSTTASATPTESHLPCVCAASHALYPMNFQRSQAKLPTAQYDSFCNLLRWYDLLQHTADSSKLFSPVAIPLPAFVPPPPPAVTTKTAKSTTAASTATVSRVQAKGFSFSLFPLLGWVQVDDVFTAGRFWVLCFP